MAADYSDQYRENSIAQADPAKLVEMLYDGAVRYGRRARKAIEEGDAEAAHNNIMRTYAIIAELMATLNFDEGGEIAMQLEQCYDYILHLLKEANIAKDIELLDKALGLIVPLQETWREAFAGSVGKGQGGDNTEHPLTAEKAEVDSAPEPDNEKPARKSLDLVG